MRKSDYTGDDPNALAAVERAMAREDGAAEPPLEEVSDATPPADPFAEADAALASLQLSGDDVISRLAPLKADSPDVYGVVVDLLVGGVSAPA